MSRSRYGSREAAQTTPPSGATLSATLARNAKERPGSLAVRFIEPGGSSLADSAVVTLTAAQLHERAQSIADVLAERAGIGARALLLCPPGLDYIAGLFGCFQAGVIAVPAYPPTSAGLDERLARVIADSGSSTILTTTPLATVCEPLQELLVRSDNDSGLVLLDDLKRAGETRNRHEPAPADLALLQYTSGSTSDPAGVMLTHAQLLANVASIRERFSIGSKDRSVVWLPPYHDMGLAGAILTTIVYGIESTVLSPLSFLARPLLWLEALSHYRGTHSGGPNFAYDLCVRKVSSDEAAELDLSAWSCAINGAEPIRLETMERFTAHFARAGFRRSAFMPAYGLAEATLLVCTSRLSERATPVDASGEGGDWAGDRDQSADQKAVSVGAVDADATLLIVDPQTRRALPEGEQGEIWFSGPSVGAGYWGNPEKSRATFEATLADDPEGMRFLRTGDLGVLRDGELYVLGRLKDMIIVRGDNYFPQDIELAATRADSHLRAGCLAAFEVDRDGRQEVILVAELAREIEEGARDGIFARVRAGVAQAVGLALDEVVLIERGAILKTSSGKIRRAATRAALLAGTLPILARSRLPAQAAAVHARAPSEHLRGVVLAELAALLGHPSAEEIATATTFRELGLESPAAVELSVRLGARTGLKLPETLCFDHPTPEALIAHLRECLEGAASDQHQVSSAAGVSASEPLAIVGMACRYPGGVDSPESLWDLVARGGDGISGFPRDRGWDLERLFAGAAEQAGASRAREGGFLADAAGFDGAFFGIGGRQADTIDPQQRQLLEVAWEALEDAGIDPTSLAGSASAVYVGVSSVDHVMRLGARRARELEAQLLTGAAASAVSGRVAYTLGLRGAAVTIDTACSSSLVALHEACRALQAGDCSLALAGGVTVLSTPAIFTGFSRQGALAADGRCKPFAASADGAGFAEGVGLLVLERLSDAERNDHRVLALVRGSAINQDGKSNGFSAPSGSAQVEVITAALSAAGLRPQDVDAVEAHGTGTPLGDPIEARALISAYGRGRRRPLWVGSVKSNIGHTQAAAGVAGVIKMVMAMQTGVLPATLHAEEPSSHVDWQAGALALLTNARRWPATRRVRRAGVSSFGISGTNAHVILEEPPRAEKRARSAPPATTPWLLSAKSETALREQARRLRAHLQRHTRLKGLDVAYTLARGRARMSHRAAIVGGKRSAMLRGLDALIAGSSADELLRGHARESAKVAFVFGGQGGQWEGMARQLLETSAIFAQHVHACAEALSPHVEWSLEDVLRGMEGAPPLERVDVVQPALWAVMVSLAELWRSYGVQPAAVVGHSQGEIAAAQIAGGLSLEDAACLVAVRSQALRALAGSGGMASLAAGSEPVERLIARWQGSITIAAINSASATVVSGADGALDQLLAHCAAEGIAARRIAVDYASHSPAVERVREQLIGSLASLRPRPGTIPFISCVDAQIIDTARLDGEYWYRSLREPVRFAQATRALLDAHCSVLIEMSPQPVLALPMQETIEERAVGEEVAVIGSLRRGQSDEAAFTSALARAFAEGVEVDWRPLFAGRGARLVGLPTYPFERERHWLEASVQESEQETAGPLRAAHPLLRARVNLADRDAWLLSGRLSLQSQPWLSDHTVHDVPVLPAGALLEIALQAASEVGCAEVEQLALETPLVIPEQGAIELQVSVGERDKHGRRSLLIAARPESGPGEVGGEWKRLAGGSILPGQSLAPGQEGITPWPPMGAERIELGYLHDRLEELGASFGEALERVQSALRLGASVYAELESGEGEIALGTLFDAALLEAIVALASMQSATPAGGKLRLPLAFHGARLHAVLSGRLRATLACEGEALSLALSGEDDTPVLSVRRIETAPPKAGALRDAARAAERELLLGLRWVAAEPAMRPAAIGEVGVLGEGRGALPGASVYRDLDALAAALADGRAPRTLVVEVGGDDRSAAGIHKAAHRALALVQSWLADERLQGLRLLLLTRGAVAAREQEAPSLAGVAVWGVIRSAQSEQPGRFALVDVDESERSRRALLQAIAINEPQLAIRAGELLIPRLAPRIDPDGDATPDIGGGTVLITGGTGQLGMLFARHLARAHGVRHLLLASRRGPAAEEAPELQAELAACGCKAHVVACDVSDAAALERLLAEIPASRPLRAVIHAAGVMDDALIQALDRDRLERVLAAKVDGALALDRLTAGCDLSAFVLISSAVGILGGAGQANYAAANCVLDALACSRRARGLPAQSLAWGLWRVDSGLWQRDQGAEEAARMDALEQLEAQIRVRLGMLALEPERGLALLDAALAAGDPFLMPIRLDMSALRANAQVDAIAPPLRGLITSPRRAVDRAGTLRRRMLAAPPEGREQIALQLVSEEVARVLDLDFGAISAERNLVELGGESLDALELRNRLEARTGARLPMRLFFGRPLRALAGHLRAEIEEGHPRRSAASKRVTALRALLDGAREAGRVPELVSTLLEVSRLRPVFETMAESQRALQLTSAGAAPQLICIPSFMPGSGAQQFARLARSLEGQRPLSVLTLPGRLIEERAPASWAIAVDALAAAVRTAAGGEPYVLLGYSSGGALAHAVAERCEAQGGGPAGVIMIDSYAVREDGAELIAAMLIEIIDRSREAQEIDDAELIALGTYLRLASEWRPGIVSAPGLFLRATQALAALPGPQLLRAPFSSAPSDAPLSADHFTIIEEHAPESAAVIESWIRRTVADEALAAANGSPPARTSAPVAARSLQSGL
ncbi:MAG TPA: SDR family NAD(P)-dependent oxidoreductase [Solirubrobacteraceae bacterium]|nr:SDR family NAD(P)-dependent oxidoreductase [Solirubrobacteraceae bacterium]